LNVDDYLLIDRNQPQAATQEFFMNKIPPIAITTDDLYYLTARFCSQSDQAFFKRTFTTVGTISSADPDARLVHSIIQMIDANALANAHDLEHITNHHLKMHKKETARAELSFMYAAQKRGIVVNDETPSVFAVIAGNDFKREADKGKIIHEAIFAAPTFN
jgi:hypothetical protein